MSDHKPHLSPSSIGLFLRCGEAWRRRYVENEKIPPGIKQIRGSAYHAMAAVNFRQKINSHSDLLESDLMDLAAEAINNARRGEWQHDEATDPKAAWAEAKDEVVNAASVFARQVSADYQPILVEETIKIGLPGASHDAMGILDMVDDRQRVTDHKTAQKAKSQQEADASLQLSFYAAAHRARYGIDPSEVRLDVVTTGGKRQVLRSTRGYSDFQRLADVVNVMLASIAAGIFTPAEPTAWWCSERWCGYAKSCKYFAGKRTAPEVVQIETPAPVAEPEAGCHPAEGEAIGAPVKPKRKKAKPEPKVQQELLPQPSR